MPRASQGDTQCCPSSPFPPRTRGDAHPATHAEAASVGASLVNGAACMEPQHPVESSLSPNLRATPRKQRGPQKFFASSEPKLSYKLTCVWEQATAPAARTNVNFPRSQIASNLLGATRQPTDEEGAGGLPLHPHARHLPRASRDYTEGWHPRGRGDASTRNFAVDDSIGAS